MISVIADRLQNFLERLDRFFIRDGIWRPPFLGRWIEWPDFHAVDSVFRRLSGQRVRAIRERQDLERPLAVTQIQLEARRMFSGSCPVALLDAVPNLPARAGSSTGDHEPCECVKRCRLGALYYSVDDCAIGKLTISLLSLRCGGCAANVGTFRGYGLRPPPRRRTFHQGRSCRCRCGHGPRARWRTLRSAVFQER